MKKYQIFSKNFEKPLDKTRNAWYNMYNDRGEHPGNERRKKKMKYQVTTETEVITITAKDEKQLQAKLDVISSFAKIVYIERIIAVV